MSLYTQDVLSKFQAIPIVGPTVFSPVKMPEHRPNYKRTVMGVFLGMSAYTLLILDKDRLAII